MRDFPCGPLRPEEIEAALTAIDEELQRRSVRAELSRRRRGHVSRARRSAGDEGSSSPISLRSAYPCGRAFSWRRR